MEQLKTAGPSSLKSLNSILMKFSQVGMGFSGAKKAFNEFDENRNGTIEYSELKEVLTKLDASIPEDITRAVFEESDMNNDGKMNFKEFIVALALIYFYKGRSIKDSASPAPQIDLGKFDVAIAIVVDAFMYFDVDHDGHLQKEEVMSTFNQATSSAGARNSTVSLSSSRKRFEEMDWDDDGKISFTEFLFAFTGWVGLEDEDEE